MDCCHRAVDHDGHYRHVQGAEAVAVWWSGSTPGGAQEAAGATSRQAATGVSASSVPPHVQDHGQGRVLSGRGRRVDGIGQARRRLRGSEPCACWKAFLPSLRVPLGSQCPHPNPSTPCPFPSATVSYFFPRTRIRLLVRRAGVVLAGRVRFDDGNLIFLIGCMFAGATLVAGPNASEVGQNRRCGAESGCVPFGMGDVIQALSLVSRPKLQTYWRRPLFKTVRHKDLMKPGAERQCRRKSTLMTHNVAP